jgi:hypothetical protein
MKRIFLILTALLAILPAALAQGTGARPVTFLNLPWGSPRAAVLRAVADTGAAVPEGLAEGSEPRVEIAGGKFAGQEVAAWTLEFLSNKLVSAAVSLRAADGDTGGLYRDLKQQLVKKYGPAPAERKFSTLTPEQRRAYTASGVRAPNRGTGVTWRFLPNLREKETLSITCEHAPAAGTDSADESLYLVTLRYTHETLRAQLAASETPAVAPESLEPAAKTPRRLEAKDL